MKLTDRAISPDLARRIAALPGDPAATTSRAIAIGVQALEEAARVPPPFRGDASLVRRAEQAERSGFVAALDAALREAQEGEPPICASRRAEWLALPRATRELFSALHNPCGSCGAVMGAWCKPVADPPLCGLPVNGPHPFAALKCGRPAGHPSSEPCASSAELRTLALPFAEAVTS